MVRESTETVDLGCTEAGSACESTETVDSGCTERRSACESTETVDSGCEEAGLVRESTETVDSRCEVTKSERSRQMTSFRSRIIPLILRRFENMFK